VESVSKTKATLLLFRAPGKSGVKAIRARKEFSDGMYKCPRTCTDSDLLLSQYEGCGAMAAKGYCGNGEEITMGGTKYSIGSQLCPKSCGQCAAALAGSPLVAKGKGCADREMRISGESCRQAAAKGLCERATNVGHVGRDLCPRSCGLCPPAPKFGGRAGTFHNPLPTRTRGVAGSVPIPPQMAVGAFTTTQPADGMGGGVPNDPNSGDCRDDSEWKDKEGDGCEVYDQKIAEKTLSQHDACSFGDGSAWNACARTCGTCAPTMGASADTCQDVPCITKWKALTGDCFACNLWPSRCNESHVANDCPKTCGLCSSSDAAAPAPAEPTEPPPPCKDRPCVEGWKKTLGQCVPCTGNGPAYCGRNKAFMESCPRTCNMCNPSGAQGASASACRDEYKSTDCAFYRQMGWCKKPDMKKNCMESCGFCMPELGGEDAAGENATSDNKTAGQGYKAGSSDGNPWDSLFKSRAGHHGPRAIEIGLFACLFVCLFVCVRHINAVRA